MYSDRKGALLISLGEHPIRAPWVAVATPRCASFTHVFNKSGLLASETINGMARGELSGVLLRVARSSLPGGGRGTQS